MKKTTRPAGFFATLTGPKNWAERLAAIKAKAKKNTSKPEPNAALKIDDANGETMDFPEIGDVSEIAEGVAVTAADGEHVFEADGKIYTLTVLGGKVTAVVVTEAEADTSAEMNAETAEFVEAVAEGLAKAEEFETTATLEIADLKKQLATAVASLDKLKATLKHGGDGLGGDDDKSKTLKIGGKTIDLSRINLK